MGDQLKVDVLLGRLNSFLFKFNSDENMRANIKHAIRRFHDLPAVKYWLSLEKKYQKEDSNMGIKSFKSWLAEQEEPVGSNYSTGGVEVIDSSTNPSSSGNRVSSTGSYRAIPKAVGKKSKKKKGKTTRKPEDVTEENPGITISFNDEGDAVCSMKNISFDNLKSLDGLLE